MIILKSIHPQTLTNEDCNKLKLIIQFLGGTINIENKVNLILDKQLTGNQDFTANGVDLHHFSSFLYSMDWQAIVLRYIEQIDIDKLYLIKKAIKGIWSHLEPELNIYAIERYILGYNKIKV